MTYQGERARPLATEEGRVFEVSKIRLATDGRISEVLWGEVDPKSDRDVGEPVVATVSEVVDAIHDGALVTAVFSAGHLPERPFVVVEHADGREGITFAAPPSPGRDLSDLPGID